MVSTSQRSLLIAANAAPAESRWTLARCALGLIAIATVSAVGIAASDETATSAAAVTASRVATGR
jgi:hypothetical protein